MYVPGTSAILLAAWAVWCFGDDAAPSTTVAVSVGGVFVLASTAMYFLLVTGNLSLFGALSLTAGLLLTGASADRAAARPEIAECVVQKVYEEHFKGIADGSHDTTLYHHGLRCPGGYPATLAEDRPLAAEGATIRVAYDPRRRVSPVAEGSASPWLPGFLALVTLGAATAGARRVAVRDSGGNS